MQRVWLVGSVSSMLVAEGLRIDKFQGDAVGLDNKNNEHA